MNHIIIEREKLEHNIHIVKEKAKSINPQLTIIAVIKGNGYGMDSVLIARKLLDNNINFFAVSEISEAEKLRKNGFENKILLLESTCIEQEINKIIELNLIATVGSINALELLNQKAKEANKVVEVHLKIDTGFGRFGFIVDNNNISQIKVAIEKSNNIKMTGTYSHFSEAYSNNEKVTRKQYENFVKTVNILKENDIQTGMLHICNSSAFFKYSDMYLDAVRIGSAFTGRLQIKEPTGLKKVGYLESEICEIRYMKKGSKIGYSGTYELVRDSKIAIVEAGYEAGVGVSGPKDSVRFIDKIRALKTAIINFGKNKRMFVVVGEKSYPVLGRIGMKNMIIDVTNANVNVGDKVKIPINLIFANSNIERQEL